MGASEEVDQHLISDRRWKQAEELFHQALECEPEQRTPFLDNLNPSIRAEVRALIDSYDAAESERVKRMPLTPSDARRIGPYTLIRELGEGGMGTVYLAERADAHFEKQVAIKLIRPGPRSLALLRRFHTERQILAGMEHPNIARLLDGGITESGGAPSSKDDGQPFLVMDYVDGQRLDKYCDEHKLGIRQRLQIFSKVCSAVHYAHQNLVVHRDLKPNNILVTADGEPKLLDFGVAKFLQQDHPNIEQTATVGLFFTPMYASPEILRGQHTTIASDVYSLGVILYQLLTGRLPHDEHALSPGELISAIITSDPRQPSDCPRQSPVHGSIASATEPPPHELAALRGETPDKLRRLLQGDLDSIVLRALGKTPAERYGSAEQLADEVNRYLGQKPVLARRQTTLYRAQKFTRRHWRGMSAAALALVMLAFAAVYSWQANLASTRRFEEARTIAKYLLFDLYDDVARLPGSTEVRARMARRAQLELDSLGKLPQSSEQMALDTAAGYDRLADVDGVSGSSSLGNTAAAAENLARAKTILSKLLSTNSRNPALLMERARNLLLDAKLQMWNRRDTKSAGPLIEQAARDLERVQLGRAQNADWLRMRWMLWVARADLAEFQDDLPGEIAAAKQGLEELATWPESLRGDENYPLWRSLLLKRWGNAVYEQTDFATSLALYQEAETIAREADARFPSHPEILYNLMDLTYQIAFPLDKLHRPREVVEALGRSTELGRRLFEFDPHNESLRRSYLNQREGLAQALAQNGRAAEAIHEEELVLADRQAAMKAQPGVNGPAEDVAFSLSVLGSVLADTGNRERGCAVLRTSMARYDELYKAGRLTAKNWNRHVGPLKQDLAKCSGAVN